MPDRVQVLSIIGSLALLAIILEAVRKRRLREQYALGWLITGVVLLILALWRDLLHGLSALIGIYYPPSALLLIGIGLIVLILLGFAVIVSELSAKVTRLSQKTAILEWELDSLRKQPREVAASEGGQRGSVPAHPESAVGGKVLESLDPFGDPKSTVGPSTRGE